MPEKQQVKIFFLFATLNASTKFKLFPEVVRAIATSPELPMASNCLEKINLKSISLPIAVIAELSVDSAIAAIAFLFFLYLTVNSVAKCCESAALPPFPKKIIFFFIFYSFQAYKTEFFKISNFINSL